jgi:hypothetical protein
MCMNGGRTAKDETVLFISRPTITCVPGLLTGGETGEFLSVSASMALVIQTLTNSNTGKTTIKSGRQFMDAISAARLGN